MSAPRPEDYTILVVDDVADNRDLMCRRFRRIGFETADVSDGEAALKRIAKGGIDLVVLDINMPGLSGLDVLRRIRAEPITQELPVIMATARSQSETVVEALSLGANDYVTKPIDFPVLNARVLSALKVSRPKTPNSAPLGIGSVLLGRYRLDRSIGRGGFGEVFRSTHLELDREVAVKVLRVPFEEGDAMARFRREGINACRVQHPHAVAVLDSGVSEWGTPFLVMELLEGHSLEERLRRSTLSARRSVAIMGHVCEALQVAHELDIVHRDVKPSNIFMHGDTPKLLDFGLAKLVGAVVVEQKITVDGWMVGTPQYMAPERFGGQVYDGKSDVYSIGVILHQMLTGTMPFETGSEDPVAMAWMHAKLPATPLRETCPHLPVQLEAVILQALSKEPERRPSAGELAAALVALDGLLSEEPLDRPSPNSVFDNAPTVATHLSVEEQQGSTVNLGAGGDAAKKERS